MKFCQNCGKEITEEVKFCASCGCAVPTEDDATEKEVVSDVSEEKTAETVILQEQNEATNVTSTDSTSQAMPKAEKIKKFVFSKNNIIIIAAVLMVLVVVGIIVGNSISLNKYKENLESTYDSMTYGAQTAEKYATLESKVWFNCINEKSSTETDKYTKDKYGRYHSDFNDALLAFYEGESRNYNLVELSVEAMQRRMSELKDCPSKFEEEYEALKELYIAYSELTELVVGNSSYSYNSFSDALEEAKSNYKSALSSAKLLLD